jgi:hypothetical protein
MIAPSCVARLTSAAMLFVFVEIEQEKIVQ